MIKNIPAEDLKLINDSFGKNSSQVLVKDSFGRIVKAEKGIINTRGYVINAFQGKRLKTNKFLVRLDGKQVTVGLKGQAFDDIHYEYRKMNIFFESDFE